jgi:hypothetical protein
METTEPSKEEALVKPGDEQYKAEAQGGEEKPEADQRSDNEEVVNPDTQEQDMDIEGDQRTFEANKRVKVKPCLKY